MRDLQVSVCRSSVYSCAIPVSALLRIFNNGVNSGTLLELRGLVVSALIARGPVKRDLNLLSAIFEYGHPDIQDMQEQRKDLYLAADEQWQKASRSELTVVQEMVDSMLPAELDQIIADYPGMLQEPTSFRAVPLADSLADVLASVERASVDRAKSHEADFL
jgi:uncharacterized protein YbaP (TraB family)